MSSPLTAKQILDREFLETRCKVLEVAAALDRLERATGDVQSDPRLVGLREALRVVLDGQADRAERVQLIFSRSYEPAWRETFGLAGQRPQT